MIARAIQHPMTSVWKKLSAAVPASFLAALFLAAGFLAFVEPGNIPVWAAEPGALLGLGPVVPFWISLAVADWGVKFAIALFGLLPFRLFVARMATRVA